MNDFVFNIDTLLGSDARQPWWRRPATWFAVVALAIAGGAGIAWQERRTEAAQPRYLTDPVTRGHLEVWVMANGTVMPTNKVDIGSELSGTVARVLVDVNDRVRKGQVLAELDSDKLRDQVARARAALEVSQAKQRQASATALESAGNLKRLQEVSRLSGGRVPSQAEMASAQAALERAQADAASTQAGIADARAALSVDETNLRKASICSPISGVVLSRSIDPGNAVAASLQAVTLFTIAEDLAHMKLQVNVDEADVGQVKPQQKATFSVSAYPDRNYPAVITRVYYGSTTTNNVVTYLTELQVSNSDLTLRPGMTATARIVTAERTGVLLVPNAALRFRPSFAQEAPANETGASGGLVSKLVPRMPGQAPRRAAAQAGAAPEVWILQAGRPLAVSVTPGANDGRLTEVQSDKLQPGMQVITEQSAGGGP